MPNPTTYVCPKCGNKVTVLVPVIEVLCGKCPRNRRQPIQPMQPTNQGGNT